MNSEKNLLPMLEQPRTDSCCQDEPKQEENPGYEDSAAAGWITGEINTANGPVYRIKTTLSAKDIRGIIKTRLNFGRMNYLVSPGLYAIGEPDKHSPVLVSANYKLSFDYLRRELGGLNLWVLVIDTKGVNVWCAAGKGSFGTAEAARMVSKVKLAKLVVHRELILPQLAAPGVSAHQLRQLCGFKVIYGPVRAKDLPGFLAAGKKATAEMRRTRFNLADRLVLAPVELVGLGIPLAVLAAFLFIMNLLKATISRASFSVTVLLSQALLELLPFFLAMLVGIVMVPALLPYIPGRALAWKGWLLGLLWAMIYSFAFIPEPGWLQIAAYLLTIPAISAFLGMNFTGSTTYTSLSGVVKEMGVALPLIIISGSLGLITLIATYFI